LYLNNRLSQKLVFSANNGAGSSLDGSTQSASKMGKQMGGRKVDRASLYMLNVREIQENGTSKTTHVEKR